jgi:opacity protein-like surface antigen
MEGAIRATGLLAAMLVVVPSWAAEEEKRGEARIYGTVGAAASLAAFDLPTSVGQQDSWGLDARAGYRVHPHVGVEGQYQWAARYELTSGGAQLNTIETHALTGNARVFIFRGPFEPYLLAGVGIVNAKLAHGDDKTEAAFRAGGGVNVFFTDHIGAYGEITYLKPFSSLNDLNAVPIAFGAVFQF